MATLATQEQLRAAIFTAVDALDTLKRAFRVTDFSDFERAELLKVARRQFAEAVAEMLNTDKPTPLTEQEICAALATAGFAEAVPDGYEVKEAGFFVRQKMGRDDLVLVAWYGRSTERMHEHEHLMTYATALLLAGYCVQYREWPQTRSSARRKHCLQITRACN